MYSKEKPESIRELFDNIAPSYDFLNNVISFGMHNFVKQNALSLIEKKEYKKIIDLCSGTGDIVIKLAKKFPQSGIIGGDFSPKMIEIAKKRTQKFSNIQIENTDVMSLQYDENSFDLSTIFFGLRNLPDIDKALEGINRILSKGGVFLIVDIVKPKSKISEFYFEKIMPQIASIFTKDKEAYKYLTESRKTFPVHNEISEILEKHNFKVIRQKEYCFGLISATVSMK